MKLISCETQLLRKIIESCGNRVNQLRDVFQLCDMKFRYKIPPR